MENFKFIIFFLLSFHISQAQRIPVEYFQKISISSSALNELKNLENKKDKSNYDILRIGELYAMNRQYHKSYESLESIFNQMKSNYDFLVLFGSVSGMISSEVSKSKSIKYIKNMKSSFESAALLKPKSIDLKNYLLELYIKLPWFLGRNNKQALRVINDLKKLSFIEGALAEGYYNLHKGNDKDALIIFLNSLNKINKCSSTELKITNNSNYKIAVLAYYLHDNYDKAFCFFENYLNNYVEGDYYPRSFAVHYLNKINDKNYIDKKIEEIIYNYDEFSRWLKSNQK